MTVLGVVQLIRGKASASFREPLFSGSSTSPSSYSLALYSGLWAFDGWDQANFVGGEVANPEKNIPRAIHSSMVVVMVGPMDYLCFGCFDLTCAKVAFRACEHIILRCFG